MTLPGTVNFHSAALWHNRTEQDIGATHAKWKICPLRLNTLYIVI